MDDEIDASPASYQSLARATVPLGGSWNMSDCSTHDSRKDCKIWQDAVLVSELVLGYLRAWRGSVPENDSDSPTQNPPNARSSFHIPSLLSSPNVDSTSTSMPDLTPSSTVNDGLSMPGTVSGVQTPTVKDPARFLTPKARKTEADGSECWSESSRGYNVDMSMGGRAGRLQGRDWQSSRAAKCKGNG